MEFPSPLHLVSLNISVTMVHLSKLKTDMGTVLLPEPQALSGSGRVIHNGLLLFSVPIQERTESPTWRPKWGTGSQTFLAFMTSPSWQGGQLSC